ncbi:MAG: membrane integrity-associated transporter subunit PqiC [Campylobacterales bacterium]|nr:membrane integrity-associated transporter subunit PqiC [Campylobacterales bacterium]
MRYLSLILIPLFWGCSSKELYTLGDTASIQRGDVQQTTIIGIETVQLPTYLKDSPIYKKDSPNHLIELPNAKWAISMDQQLTQVLINYLQKRQNNPNVHAYPWDNVDQPLNRKVSVHITNFIAYNHRVILEASYQIADKQTNKTKNVIFSTEEPLSNDQPETIVQSMEQAFFKLAQEINEYLCHD